MIKSAFVLLILVVTCSCASTRGYMKNGTLTYGTGMGDRTYIVPDTYKSRWQGVECTPRQVKAVYAALKAGQGSSGSVLYYYRCRGPNEYKAYLAAFKSRMRRRY